MNRREASLILELPYGRTTFITRFLESILTKLQGAHFEQGQGPQEAPPVDAAQPPRSRW